MSPHALISGASVAGPALAHQLAERGWRTTVLERAPALREEGQNIDIRGNGREVIRRMGLEDKVLAATTTEVGTRFVDTHGTEIAAFPAGRSDTGGITAEAEILRGTLGRLLYEHTRERTEYRFGAQISEIREHADGVSVTLRGGETIEADVLVVAEGTRSRTRELLFDDVTLEELGLYVAYLAIPRVPADDRWWSAYNAVGNRSIGLRPDNVGTTRAMLAFLSGVRGLETLGRDDQVTILRRTYADAGWQADRILAALDDAPYYFDAIAKVHAPRWHTGRTALLGDAAWSTGPFGTGTSLALTGAYVLAGELATRSDPRAAFARYQDYLRPFVAKAQGVKKAQIRANNPSSRLGITLQRTVMRLASTKPMMPLFEKLTAPPTEAIALPGYPAPELSR